MRFIIHDKLRSHFVLFIPFLLLFIPSICNSLTTGADFLNINTSVRATSMGGFVGIADDASAVYYNPAGLAQLKQNEISAQHTNWLAGIKQNFLSGIFHLKGKNLGFSALMLSDGKLEARDENEQKVGEFSAYDLAISFCYAQRIEFHKLPMYLGGNLKFIRQKIEDEKASGIATDIGVLYKFAQHPISIGFSVQNLGPQMKFISEKYNLPFTIASGIGYYIHDSLLLVFDIKRKIYDRKNEVSIGTEFRPISFLALRTGYLKSLNPESIPKPADFKGFSAGIGIKFLNFLTDYAFIPYSDLGDTHRISFGIKF